MPIKDLVARQKYHREYMRAHGDRYLSKETVHAYLECHPCVDCGESDPVVLEFDHRDPKTKRFSISRATSRRTYRRETLLTEIAKCDVRCANCHRRKSVRESREYWIVMRERS